jgi:signal transduction histidine kinase/CheY-like chemotaxis protein
LSELKDRETISQAKEIMAVFPTVKSVRSTYKLALIQQLILKTQSNFNDSDTNQDNSIDNNPKIRIIIPQDKEIDDIIQEIRQNKNTHVRNISGINDVFMDKAIFIIIDKKTSIIIKTGEQGNNDECRDGNNDDDGCGDNKNSDFSPKKQMIYSYSRYDDETDNGQVVFSHIAAFEMIWKLTGALQKVTNNDQVKEDFVNICAHELRSPIQPILGLSILVKNKITDANQREILDVIIRNARRLKRLADDLLEVTKIESNLIKLDKEKFNLNDFLNETLFDYETKVSKEENNDNNTPHFNIIKSIPDEIVFSVDADKDRLIQVIHNILNNAVRARSDENNNNDLDNEAIYFSLRQNNENEVQISVKDRGSGIDDEILSDLFTKFITKSGKGIGLGLFIAKNIIEAHDGKIWATNNNDGKGATFYFTLPIIMQSTRNVKFKKILLINDKQSFALTLKTTLEDYGKYKVDIFDSPSAVLQGFVSGYYDFVVLDIEMQEISGFDLSQKIRKKDNKVEVVFMTSGGTNYEPLKELYGISEKNHFIKKFHEPDKILRQINGLIEDR